MVEYVIATVGWQSLQKIFFLSIILPFESPGNPKYSLALLSAFGGEISCSYCTSDIFPLVELAIMSSYIMEALIQNGSTLCL